MYVDTFLVVYEDDEDCYYYCVQPYLMIKLRRYSSSFDDSRSNICVILLLLLLKKTDRDDFRSKHDAETPVPKNEISPRSIIITPSVFALLLLLRRKWIVLSMAHIQKKSDVARIKVEYNRKRCCNTSGLS
jgi:hypothetical protein